MVHARYLLYTIESWYFAKTLDLGAIWSLPGLALSRHFDFLRHVPQN